MTLDPATLGQVQRLQVQRSRLKPGSAGLRRYDPSPLLAVDRLSVGAAGCLGGLPDGSWLVDVHNPAHPDTRAAARAVNGVSIMTTAAYVRLRHRFGGWIADGLAGENVLVDSDLQPADLIGATLTLGTLTLTDFAVANPCVEFTRWCLRRDDLEVDDEVRVTLDSLGGGARGVYATVVTPGTVPLGAGVVAAAGSR